ncbi:Prohibitin-1, mitochondrial [Triticum urartu]|uniref:Prohibitin n=1 Tax=Triticum urartu TaxID=4572 RepID=M8AIC9_TRIUA|nr:Prohibitin-1, mitochondrial [Triticum urartu]
MSGGGQAAVSFLTKLAKVAAGLGLTASAVSTSLYTVDGGQRAVIFDRFQGVLPAVVSEGTHFLVPWLQKPFLFDIRTRPHSFSSTSGTKDLQMAPHSLVPWLQKPFLFDIRTRPHSFSSTSGTKDLQMVSLTLRVLARPDVERLPEIFTNLGLDYDDKVLPSIGNEVLKAVVAQFNADQLLTDRPHVSALVREALVRRAGEFNIVLDDVAITHLAYGHDFAQAVEKKQVAQQEAERSRFLVARAEQERRAAIVRAEGESESARLISDATALVGNGLIELRRIEAAKEIAGVIARSPNVSYIPSGNNGQMLLGLSTAR